MTLPRPEPASHTVSAGVIGGTGPEAAARGPAMIKPTSIIQATVDEEPMRRLDRDEVRFAAAQRKAAPSPPRIAIMRQVWGTAPCFADALWRPRRDVPADWRPGVDREW